MRLDFLFERADDAASRLIHVARCSGMPGGSITLIDRAQLATLAGEVGSALPGIMETFQNEIRDRLIAMRRLLQDGDRVALSAEAHSIKGTASALGLTKLSHDAKLLERGAGTMSGEEMAALLRTIQRSFYESCSCLVELGHLPPFNGSH
jgi:HPt (histidine-containing phosphotransfer) domain-containing protein